MVDGTDGLGLPREGFPRGCGVARVLMAVAVGALAMGCGDDPEVTEYSSEVRPIFQARCFICHRPGSVSDGTELILDIENPFGGGRGMVGAENTWALAYPGAVDDIVVVPGDPDNSFLIDKLTGDLPSNGNGGSIMPPPIEAVSEEELALLEQWVADGAQNDAFFRDNIQRNIFGDGTVRTPGTCTYCHYANTPNLPDLTNPFDPVTGVVNVVASYRSNIMRVVPGDPDNSFLILKVRLGTRAETQTVEAIARNGPPMPYQFEELSESEVQTVRDWITEGALDN